MSMKEKYKELIGKKSSTDEPISKKAKRKENLLENSQIYSNYYKDIDENLVYLESRDGNDFTGNIFRMIEELSTGDYSDLKIAVFVNEKGLERLKEAKKNYNLKINKIIKNEVEATKVAGQAKYIITDSGIRPKYVKRPEQIFLYTAHGTPLKTMGIDNRSEEYTIGSVQHSLLSADYLLYPNNYMREKMINAYLIDKIYPGKILMEGYPRNSIFFDDERREELKSKLKLKDKEIFIYMPTFKGTYFNRKDEKQTKELMNYFLEVDKHLNDNQIFIVKLHNFNESEIDYSELKHIKSFPEGYETYDVLNMADVLITDYSSVFFDFANTKRKIVLFNYDEEEYMKYRGTYFPLSDLPFPKVQTIDDLVKELNSPKNYDDSEFLEKFCAYDRPNAAKYICKHIFKGEKVCKEEEIAGNGKPNILIFAGGLLKNGITASFINLIKNIDRTKYNIFISYRQQDWYIRRNHEFIFDRIPDDVEFLPLRSKLNMTKEEDEVYQTFIKNKGKDAKYPKSLDNFFKRELRRFYPDLKFDKFIHFDGYGNQEMLLFKNLDCEKSIWVHTDMVQEIETKRNQHIGVLKEVYCEYDNVVVVSPELIKPTSEFVDEEKIKIVHNLSNAKENRENASQDIFIDKNTIIITHNPRSIRGILDSPGKKFIAIGKFLKEKGHERLLDVFEEFAKDYPDTQLIILGGYGNQFEILKEKRAKSKYWKNIAFIKWIANPMPILKDCDLLIIPSYYEGWPLSMIEADSIDIPVLATDIVGTQIFKEYGGYTVENSNEGLLQGLYDFMEGKINPLNVDWEEYDKKAIEEFYSIIDGEII